MNWTGLVFGASAALALAGGIGAAFSRTAQASVFSLAAAMFGVAGLCLALGNDFIAIAVLTVLGAAVPSAMLAATLLAPPPAPDVRPGATRMAAVCGSAVLAFIALALLLTRTLWAPVGGPRQMQIEWLGSRFLTDHLITLVLIACVLSTAGMGAVALLRPRRAGPR